MKKNFKTHDLVISALLIAIGILIPMIFTGPPFRIIVGPYTATIMAHVPVIIAMFISPQTAVFTAVGTTIGFFFTAPVIVAVRAASHIIFAIVGTYCIKKGMTAVPLCGVTGLIHAFLEGAVVLIFFAGGLSTPSSGYSITMMVIITCVGTLVHHIIDFIISYAVGGALHKAKLMPKLPPLAKNQIN